MNTNKIDPKLNSYINFNSVGSLYDEISLNYFTAFTAPRFLYEDEIVKKQIKRIIKNEHIKVLDIGCGAGHGITLCPKDIEYTGIDISPKMLEIAKKVYPSNNFLLTSVESLPFEDNSFDVCVSFYGSLSHVSSIKKAICEINRVLTDSGFFLGMFYSLKNYPQKTNLKEVSGMYQVRGLEHFSDVENPLIPAKFYSSEYLKQLFQDMFCVKSVKGLTMFYDSKDPKGGVFGIIPVFLDRVLSCLSPDKCHTLIIIARKGLK